MSTPDSPHANAGKTLIQIIWEELDEVVYRLKIEGKPSETEPPSEAAGEGAWEEFIDQEHEEWQHYGEERGQAQGLAYALAVLTNPYNVNVDVIREQALKRWEKNHDHDD